MIVILTPGDAPLHEWRAVARGAQVILDPAAEKTIAAGAAAVAALLAGGEPVYGINTGFGKLASVRIADADLERLQHNLVISHASGVGEPLAPEITRLMMALKLANLGQGASGVRVETARLIEAMLARDVTPLVPAQGSVGASGDLAPLSHMTATMIGVGEAFFRGERMAATEALARADLAPIRLGPKEGLALLNGTQFSTANALHALFATERVFRTALVAGALTTDAAKGSDGPFDARIQRLRRHPGQIEAAATLRALMTDSAIRASHQSGDDRIQDPYCLRCQPQVMGAALDILRSVAVTLEHEANGVTDNPLIFHGPGQEPQAISGGNFHAEPVAFAADIMAMALCEIGSLAERRISLLVDPTLSRLPAFLTPRPGLNSGFMIPQVTAAALVSENKQMAHPASVDSIPTSANQEDHVSMAAHGAYRLHRMVRNVANVLAIELLAAAQACDFHVGLTSSPALERVRAAIRAKVPALDDDRFFAPDIATIADMVLSGEIEAAVAPLTLPDLTEARP